MHFSWHETKCPQEKKAVTLLSVQKPPGEGERWPSRPRLKAKTLLYPQYFLLFKTFELKLNGFLNSDRKYGVGSQDSCEGEN